MCRQLSLHIYSILTSPSKYLERLSPNQLTFFRIAQRSHGLDFLSHHRCLFSSRIFGACFHVEISAEKLDSKKKHGISTYFRTFWVIIFHQEWWKTSKGIRLKRFDLNCCKLHHIGVGVAKGLLPFTPKEMAQVDDWNQHLLCTTVDFADLERHPAHWHTQNYEGSCRLQQTKSLEQANCLTWTLPEQRCPLVSFSNLYIYTGILGKLQEPHHPHFNEYFTVRKPKL